MNRLAFSSLALVFIGIGVVAFAPSTEQWHIAGGVAIVVGVVVLVALLAYRILHDGKGEDLIANSIGGDEDVGHH